MKRIISVILLMSILFAVVFYTPANAQMQITGITNSEAKMYSNAGTSEAHTVSGEASEFIMKVPANSTVSVLSSKIDGDGDKWYLVNYNGTNGYLVSNRVRLPRSYDSDFENNLLYFPEEYRTNLRNLHNEYPNWRFIAEPTGLTFSQAVDFEYCPGDNKRPRKFVELTYMGEEWRDERAKRPDGTYENAEGGNWTYASRMAISHFMNPVNFLNSNDIFMFLLLSYDAQNQTRDMVKTVVSGTFLDSDAYIDAIMQAAAESKFSPLAMISLIIVEQKVNGSSAVTGNYPGYEGYYNFFNVGANGATDAEIVASGLAYAKNAGWNSISAAMIGGANFCKNGYIANGQDTYYYMDYNVVLGNYNNQYATAIYDAYNKGKRLSAACTTNKNAVLEFVIPIFLPENSNSGTSVVPTPTPTPTPTATVKYGDIDNNGVINEVDLAGVKLHILKRRTLTGKAFTAGDIDKNNVINEVDLAAVKLDILGRRKISS